MKAVQQQEEALPPRVIQLTTVQKNVIAAVESPGMGAKLPKKTRETIRSALRNVKIFLGLSQLQQKECVTAMDMIQVKSGAIIAKKGELSDYVWVIEEGEVAAMVKKGQEERRIGPGAAFGEVPLLCNGQQSHTFKATKACKIWRLERMCYRRISARNHGSHAKVAEEWSKHMSSWEDLEAAFKKNSSTKSHEGKETLTMGIQVTGSRCLPHAHAAAAAPPPPHPHWARHRHPSARPRRS